MNRLILAAMMLAMLLGLMGMGCSEQTGGVGQEAGAPDGPAVDLRSVDGPLADTGAPDRTVPADLPPADSAAADAPPAADRPPSSDAVLTGDAAAFPKCTGVGGICTRHRWIVCPVNTEPVNPSPRQDCTSGGWCCVKAPASTCSAAKGVNCIHGSKCTGCWAPATNTSLKCETGRVCCQDICD